MITTEIVIPFLNSLNTHTHRFLPCSTISVTVSPMLPHPLSLGNKHYILLDSFSCHIAYPIRLKISAISTFKIHPELNHWSIITPTAAFLFQASTISPWISLKQPPTCNSASCFHPCPRGVYAEHISQMAVFKRLVKLCHPQLHSLQRFLYLSE